MFNVTSSYVILCLRAGPPFNQHGTVDKNRYKLSVCEVAGSSKLQGEEFRTILLAKGNEL